MQIVSIIQFYFITFIYSCDNKRIIYFIVFLKANSRARLIQGPLIIAYRIVFCDPSHLGISFYVIVGENYTLAAY